MTDLPPELQALYTAERASNVADLAGRASVRAKITTSVGAVRPGAGSATRTALTVAKVLVAIALVVGAGVLATRSSHVASGGHATPIAATAGASPVVPAVEIQSAPRGLPPTTAAPQSTAANVSAETPRVAPTKNVRARKAGPVTSDQAPSQTQAELLHAAWLALSSDEAKSALSLVERDAADHPTGALVEERFAIQIEALAALHRTSEAEALFTRFASLYPDSVHRAHLAHAVGAKESL
ncbi:hypothetical protein BH11MYX2_BH11MYX2_34500 [soil metagenome]